MEHLEHLKEYILTVHPVRRSTREKGEFRAWAAGEFKRAGWKSREETYGKTNGSVNLIAGNPEKAEIFLCAHYDTGSRMLIPNFVAPLNAAAHVGYHTAAAVALVALSLLLSLAVSFPLGQPGLMLPLFVILAVGGLALSVYGPANRENANGNSSGVAAVLELAHRLRGEERVCLLLLDNNERNFLGAKAFAKHHPDAAARSTFINLDCVGDGEHLLLMPSRQSRWDEPLLHSLEEAFVGVGQLNASLVTVGLVYYPSDHRSFRRHVAVCTCRKMRLVGHYIPHLRTGKDKTLKTENIRCLADGMERFLQLYFNREKENTP